jgi:Spy/CpxP family protein refolding chaperone
MKNSVFNYVNRMLLGMGILMMALTGAQAQRGYNIHSARHYRADSGIYACSHLKLTDEQESRITGLRITHQKEMTAFRNDLAIKRAELQKYKSADTPDVSLINRTIEEIGKLTVEMQKKRAAHELAVRELLTDEQKAVFDSQEQDFHAPQYRHPGMYHRGNRFNHSM